MTYLEKAVQTNNVRSYCITNLSINKNLKMDPENLYFDNKTGTIIPGVPVTIYGKYARNSTQLIDRNGNLTKEISLNIIFNKSFSVSYLFELK